MTRRLILGLLTAAVAASPAAAQVSIRLPFVRIDTGGPGGTYVQAPFVRIYSPPSPPPIVFGPPLAPPPGVVQPAPAEPGVAQLPPPRLAPQPLPEGPTVPDKNEPPVDPDLAPPAPAQAPASSSLQDFVKSFKAKAGNYEIPIANPINGRPETVRFSLPGEPRQVRTTRNSVEFIFGPRSFVRIEFDADGPIVTSR